MCLAVLTQLHRRRRELQPFTQFTVLIPTSHDRNIMSHRAAKPLPKTPSEVPLIIYTAASLNRDPAERRRERGRYDADAKTASHAGATS